MNNYLRKKSEVLKITFYSLQWFLTSESLQGFSYPVGLGQDTDIFLKTFFNAYVVYPWLRTNGLNL